MQCVTSLSLFLLLEVTWSVAPFLLRTPHPALDWLFFLFNVASSICLFLCRVVFIPEARRGWGNVCCGGSTCCVPCCDKRSSHSCGSSVSSYTRSTLHRSGLSGVAGVGGGVIPAHPDDVLHYATGPDHSEVFASNSIITNTGNVWHTEEDPDEAPPGGFQVGAGGHSPRPNVSKRRRSKGIIKYGRPDVRFADTLAKEERDNESNSAEAATRDKTEL